MQFLPCLENIPSPPGSDLKAALISALQEAFGTDADVRYLCLVGKGTIAIWLRSSVSASDSDARDRGLQRLNLLRPGENFALFENASFIRRSALEKWDSMSKRLNGDGNADPNGPIHLTSFSVAFRDPDRVLTIVEGFDERPWPDVDFKLTISDTLSVSGGEFHCESDRHLDVDTSWLNFLTGVFLFAFPPLGITFLAERIIISTVDVPEGQSGVGCQAMQLIPGEIMIRGGLKIIVYYNRINVSSGGIFAGGTAAPVPRSPVVSIRGRTQLSVDLNSPTKASPYAIVTDDLLEPLQIAWTPDGTVLTPGAVSTFICFNTAGSVAGQVLTKRVAVRVTDRDNLSATAEIIVRIHITDPEAEIPLVCRKKPWLPQCQPQ
jgi:hypothetical protein